MNAADAADWMIQMPENKLFLPEGFRPQAVLTPALAKEELQQQTILEGTVLRCDSQRNLWVSLGNLTGVIPRSEAVAPWVSGSDKEISLLSRVGRQVCFQVTSVTADEKGAPVILLSRRAAQERAKAWFLESGKPGMVLASRITHLESYGAFLDIGCGIVALLPVERISVSRISRPADRLQLGQKLPVILASIDPATPRFTMSHKELLGTWMENASWFHAGDTVPGIVRTVRDYGCFVELTPNLSGLAEYHSDLQPGNRVSVYLKSIRPERMKVKLQIIEKLPPLPLAPMRYQVTDGCLDRWTYSPPNYEKTPVETIFTACP